jgi:hypothetical protein
MREILFLKTQRYKRIQFLLQRKKLLTPPFNVSLQPNRGIKHIGLEDWWIPEVTLIIQRTRYMAGGL